MRVLPSGTRGGINEKFGRVLIEAMAARTVAVGCDDGGIAAVCENHSYDVVGRKQIEGLRDDSGILIDTPENEPT